MTPIIRWNTSFQNTPYFKSYRFQLLIY